MICEDCEIDLEPLDVSAFWQAAGGAAWFCREDHGSQQRPDAARSGSEHERPGDPHGLR